MKKSMTFFFLMTMTSAMAGMNSSEPTLKIRDRNGNITKVFTLATIEGLKKAGEYGIYNPFELVNACYTGDSSEVVKEILLSDDLLDHAGDYACNVEALPSSDQRVIRYTCNEAGNNSASFKIVPCPKR